MVDMNFLCPNGDRGIFVHVGLREILVQDLSFGGNVELNFPPSFHLPRQRASL